MPPISLEQALDILEIKDKSIILKMHNAKSFEEAEKVVEELHAMANKQKKKLAKIYHPDIGGDEEKLKQINMIVDLILKVKAERRPMIQPMTIIIRNYYESTTTSTTTDYWHTF